MYLFIDQYLQIGSDVNCRFWWCLTYTPEKFSAEEFETSEHMNRNKIAEGGLYCMSCWRLPGVSRVTRCASGVKKPEHILCASGVTCMVSCTASVGGCSNLELDLLHFFH